MSIFIFVFIIFFGLVSSTFCEPEENIDTNDLNLSSLIETSLDNNPSIRASEKRVEEAKGLLLQAGLSPNPRLEVGGGSSSILGDPGNSEWSVGLVQTFELGHKRKKRMAVANIELTVAGQQLQEQKRQLVLQIKKDFADFLAGAQLLAETARSVQLHKRLHEITSARVQEGEAAAFEEGLSQLELNRIELERASLVSDVETAASRLRTLAGLEEKTSFQGNLAEDIAMEHHDLAELLLLAQKGNPELQIARLEQRQAEAGVSLSKAEGISDLDLFVEYSNEKQRFDAFVFDESRQLVPLEDDDRMLSAGVSIQLPFSRNQGNVKAAVARLEQAKLKTGLLEKTIEQQVKNSFRKYQAAGEAYRIYKDAILRQSEDQLSILRASFEAGELRFLDWLNEQKRALEIQRSFVLAAKEYFLAAAELEFVTASGLQPAEDL